MDPEADLETLNQELQRTEWEIGYTPAKLAAAAIARPVISPPRPAGHSAAARQSRA